MGALDDAVRGSRPCVSVPVAKTQSVTTFQPVSTKASWQAELILSKCHLRPPMQCRTELKTYTNVQVEDSKMQAI